MSGLIKNMSQSRPGEKNGMYGMHRYGQDNPFHGRRHSEETKRKISETKKGVIANEKHPMWRGDNASYDAIHLWVRRNKGKAQKCNHCPATAETTKIHWANIDNKYSRNLEDYFELCAKCHWAYDKKFNSKKTGVNHKLRLNMKAAGF